MNTSSNGPQTTNEIQSVLETPSLSNIDRNSNIDSKMTSPRDVTSISPRFGGEKAEFKVAQNKHVPVPKL